MTAFDERDQGPPRSLTSRPRTEFLPIAEKGSWFELLVFVLSPSRSSSKGASDTLLLDMVR